MYKAGSRHSSKRHQPAHRQAPQTSTAYGVQKGWLASHPRFVLLWLPTYCPRANPIERAFGDVHDKCTRNHTRKRLRDLVQDVERHVQENGPWRTNSPSSMMHLRLQRRLSTSPPSTTPRSPRECTNLLWADLG
jgi:transposase